MSDTHSALNTISYPSQSLHSPRNSFVAYYRVSTERQGRSGLGLEAQQAAVRAYLNGGSWTLADEVIEVESGKRDDRPKLQEALKLCRVTGSKLIVAKLDRLARNAAFLFNLRDAGVPFVAADMPDANELTVGIMAVVAEAEAKAISRRTKEALQAAKERGRELGGWRGGPKPTSGMREAAKAARKDRSQDRARDLIGVIADVQATLGPNASLGSVAKELTQRGIRTPSGKPGSVWQGIQVARVLALVGLKAG
jgi:DNA invertase Pin-like site-specific DNA recombinase